MHGQLRELGNSGRHLYLWFERYQDLLARGLAAELTLDAAHHAVYNVPRRARHRLAHGGLPHE